MISASFLLTALGVVSIVSVTVLSLTSDNVGVELLFSLFSLVDVEFKGN